MCVDLTKTLRICCSQSYLNQAGKNLGHLSKAWRDARRFVANCRSRNRLHVDFAMANSVPLRWEPIPVAVSSGAVGERYKTVSGDYKRAY